MSKFYKKGNDQRILDYTRYEQLRKGQHEQAFASYIRQTGSVYLRDAKMGMPSRFFSINLPKEISRISADLLFDEKPKIKTDKNNDFINECIEELQLYKIFYENADFGSAKGDCVLKVRVEDNELRVESVNPSLYYPIVNEDNIGDKLEAEEIWNPVMIQYGNEQKDAVIVERYEGGKIYYSLVVDSDGTTLPIEQYFPEYAEAVETGIDSPMIIHIKNSGVPTDYFGISDYADVEDLIYAIDNRFSRIEAILDKHSSPILQLPKGILDKNGNIKRQSLDIVEIFQMGENQADIKYISWDGQLASAFDQLSKSIDLCLMISNISSSLVGRDEQGMAESGRALKYRLLRTLAMKHRKEMYWGYAIKQLFDTLQELSAKNGYTVNGVRSAEPELITIEWQDGIINDAVEQIDVIEKQLALGLISEVDAIAQMNDVENSVAEEKLKLIKESKKEESPIFKEVAIGQNNDEE